MRFFAVLALFATATVALPSEAAVQDLCIGLNDRWCSNSTVDYKCCMPLVCGSDSRCHEPY